MYVYYEGDKIKQIMIMMSYDSGSICEGGWYVNDHIWDQLFSLTYTCVIYRPDALYLLWMKLIVNCMSRQRDYKMGLF